MRDALRPIKELKLEALGQCIPPLRHVLPVSRYGSGSLFGSVIRIATKFNRLFTVPLSTIPENFMQMHLEVFAQSS